MTERKSFRRYATLFLTLGSMLALGPVAPVLANPESAVEGDVGDVPLARTGYPVLPLALLGTVALLAGVGLLAARRA